MIAIVPNYVRDAINAKLDDAYIITPGAEIDRLLHYNALLAYFDEHGEIPDFQLQHNSKPASKGKSAPAAPKHVMEPDW